MAAVPAVPRVSVLGAGSWGTALAALATERAPTVLWARDAELARALRTHHRNPRYLPDIALPETLTATAELDDALTHVLVSGQPAGLIILGVPVAGMAGMCAQLADMLRDRSYAGLSVVWTCKGFQPDTGKLPHEIVADAFREREGLRTGVLSGPSFAREVACGLPVALTVASAFPEAAQAVTAALHGRNARIYSSSDVIGVEVGGALKNVIAIACGISDGLALGTNARAALITRGLSEMQRLGVAMGGHAETFAGLTGLGDLVLTATGELSRNRQVGLAIAQGRSLADILAGGMTAEGVRCARAAYALGQRYGVVMPITEAVCQVLFEGLPARVAVSALLARDPVSETSSHR